MATLIKGSAILFFICAFSGRNHPKWFAANGHVPNPNKIGNTVPLAVNLPAEFAVPIAFTSQDYSGPYDPYDPQGLYAAARRMTVLTGQQQLETVKSYIPPDLGKVVKRELIKVAVNEGKRFAVSHPKETSELIGIATKAKALYDTASKKVIAAEKLQAQQVPPHVA